jgi:type VI secretion system lysozyme-like protein
MPLFDRFFLDKRKDADLRSVVDNLNHMLNSRKTFGTYLRDYGIGDFNEYKARQKIIDTVIAEIKESIRRYEPRVVLDSIREVESDSPFKIRLEMRCVVHTADRPIYILIDSVNNKVSLEDL